MKRNYELRKHDRSCTNFEWGEKFHHPSFVICFSAFFTLLLLIAFPAQAQVGHIVTIRPDRAAPGMNVVVELLARESDPRPFGYDVLDSSVRIVLLNAADSERVIVGPTVVAWNGRVLQVSLFIAQGASLGPVPFYVLSAQTGPSDTVNFFIDSLQHLGPITTDTTIGDGFGQLSAGNTILVDSLIVTNAHIHFSTINPDTFPSNPRLLPVVILSKGPVRLSNSTISVDADGINGGPGGGGGGHGWGGAGGIGFTGGGSCPSDSLGNSGSASEGFDTLGASGGVAATGVMGGESNPDDQGGGGGTGAPYGMSGVASLGSSPSSPGGYGGGSGGGEAVNPFIEYGGGGGGFGTVGIGGFDQHFGNGANGGQVNGGRFLVPFAGGSGGGAGNSVDLGDGTLGGSGGGGGGSLELVSFDSIVTISSTFSARGDSGTSGVAIAAGGGGGSGGAIYLASPKGIRGSSTNISVEGGNAGQPGIDSSGFAGGLGGLGRVRIDGSSNLMPGKLLTPVWTNGIALSPTPTIVNSNGTLQITGYAQDLTNTLDTIRIFYRTQHTGWQWVDTVRDSTGNWSKWLPLLHDSLLYVVAFVEVNQPSSDPTHFIYEPGWLVSDVSMALISHSASPFLVVEDTLDFGTVRVGRCKTLALVVRNEGEAPLTIGKGSISGPFGFSLVPDTALLIPPSQSDTLQVEFCPDSAASDLAAITFLSNDPTDSTKVITLFGTGLVRQDSLVISPSNVNFGNVSIGDCKSDTVLLLSAGADTLYLDRSSWDAPPFSMRLEPPDTALAPKQKRMLIVTFCPTDSGDAHLTQVLDVRQDSIVIEGIGVSHLASSLGARDLGLNCLGHVVTFIDTISDLGNDTITLQTARSQDPPQQDSIDVILQPNERYPVQISWVPDSTGRFTDTILYQLSDTILSTILSYRVVGAHVHFDSVVPFHFVCISDSVMAGDTLVNLGHDTLAISISNLNASGRFAILDSLNRIIPGQISPLRFSFTPSEPSDTVELLDTIQLILSDDGCDSTIDIVLSGKGIESGLAAESIGFDSVLAGSCREDSSLIGNPCGPSVLIDSIAWKNSAFQLSSSMPILVPSFGSAEVKFLFCPSDSGTAIDTATLYPNVGKPFKMALRGIGYKPGSLWAHFTISSAAARAGDTVVTAIRLDSSSLTGVHAIRAAVSYDPSVVYFIKGFTIPAQAVTTDSIVFSGTIDFSDTGFIEAISWLTLLGPKASSVIGLDLSTNTPVNIGVTRGSVEVTDCTGLNGQFLPGGNYAIGPITPNPASETASFGLQLGNDGYVEAGLYDMTGRLIATILSQSFTRGTYTINIPMDALSSGRYMVEVSSLGWRAATPFIIDR
jgi:hypothetical protein